MTSGNKNKLSVAGYGLVQVGLITLLGGSSPPWQLLVILILFHTLTQESHLLNKDEAGVYENLIPFAALLSFPLSFLFSENWSEKLLMVLVVAYLARVLFAIFLEERFSEKYGRIFRTEDTINDGLIVLLSIVSVALPINLAIYGILVLILWEIPVWRRAYQILH